MDETLRVLESQSTQKNRTIIFGFDFTVFPNKDFLGFQDMRYLTYSM